MLVVIYALQQVALIKQDLVLALYAMDMEKLDQHRDFFQLNVLVLHVEEKVLQ